ncbi:MAG: hypothetical protein JNK93_08240 [Planctomycetia bacterium]|nr:hypothetical protein [Planctomycetia bacterium]
MRNGKPVLAMLLLLSMCLPSAAQGVPAAGTEILRGLLKFQGFQPVEALGRDTRSTLIVIVGRPFLPNNTVARMPRHLADGGGLLVVSNNAVELRNLLPRVDGFLPNGRITGLSVENPNRDVCFGGDARSPLPVLTPADPTLFRLAKRGAPAVLATREPSTVTVLPNAYLGVELAHFPPGTRYVGGQQVGNKTPLAVMSDLGAPGTAMVYANRAMFENEFMVAADANGNRTDNFLYSFLVTRYLAGRMKDNGAPLECLFIEDGLVNTDFDRVGFVERPEMQLPPGAIPPNVSLPMLMDILLDRANIFVDKLEEKDFPNLIQQQDHKNIFQEFMLIRGLIILTPIMLYFLISRGLRSRHTRAMAPRVRIDPDRGGFIPERRYSILESGNLHEPMRDHLRRLFDEWGAPGDLADGLPTIAADRPTRPIRRIGADLFRLWTIAYGPDRVPVSPDDLEELEDMISELSKAHEFGVWRFAGGTA